MLFWASRHYEFEFHEFFYYNPNYQVVAQEKANEELKVLRKFHKEASENQANMKSAIENMKKLKKEATIVAEALENTMHQLPVHGAKVSYFQKFTRKFRDNYF